MCITHDELPTVCVVYMQQYHIISLYKFDLHIKQANDDDDGVDKMYKQASCVCVYECLLHK